MFEARKDNVDSRVHKYTIACAGQSICCADAIKLWQDDASFRSFFVALLSESPFSVYRWETPPLTRSTLSRPFEFVLLESAGLARAADPTAFAEHFIKDDTDEAIVVFENLGRDATLVVPSPRGPHSAYGHLAAFLRGAPAAQTDILWQVIGRTIYEKIGDRPIWLSTAGGGVAWLHVRLDSRPKYYGYAPYKEFVQEA